MRAEANVAGYTLLRRQMNRQHQSQKPHYPLEWLRSVLPAPQQDVMQWAPCTGSAVEIAVAVCLGNAHERTVTVTLGARPIGNQTASTQNRPLDPRDTKMWRLSASLGPAYGGVFRQVHNQVPATRSARLRLSTSRTDCRGNGAAVPSLPTIACNKVARFDPIVSTLCFSSASGKGKF
eukprot:COSAG06_NODE_2989_length_5984_cov_4.027698_4_plen_178_part_00